MLDDEFQARLRRHVESRETQDYNLLYRKVEQLRVQEEHQARLDLDGGTCCGR